MIRKEPKCNIDVVDLVGESQIVCCLVILETVLYGYKPTYIRLD